MMARKSVSYPTTTLQLLYPYHISTSSAMNGSSGISLGVHHPQHPPPT